jgi:hypothetical protein
LLAAGKIVSATGGEWYAATVIRLRERRTLKLSALGVPIVKDYPVYNVKAEVGLNVAY